MFYLVTEDGQRTQVQPGDIIHYNRVEGTVCFTRGTGGRLSTVGSHGPEDKRKLFNRMMAVEDTEPLTQLIAAVTSLGFKVHINEPPGIRMRSFVFGETSPSLFDEKMGTKLLAGDKVVFDPRAKSVQFWRENHLLSMHFPHEEYAITVLEAWPVLEGMDLLGIIEIASGFQLVQVSEFIWKAMNPATL